MKTNYASVINELSSEIYENNVKVGWWPKSPDSDHNIVPAKLCLIHSEVSEAMEGHRKSLMDDKLPHRPMCEVELADVIIRVLDLAGALGYDLGGAIQEKRDYNAQRADHKLSVRTALGGKTY